MNHHGLGYVVDMDLSKCFDPLDHELILQGNTPQPNGLDRTLTQDEKDVGMEGPGSFP